MKIKEILKILITYSSYSVGSGKTRLIINGLKETKNRSQVGLVTNTIDLGQNIISHYDLDEEKVKVFSLNNLDQLRSQKIPVTFDNNALEYIFNNSLSEIIKLESLNESLNIQINILKRKNLELKDANRILIEKSSESEKYQKLKKSLKTFLYLLTRDKIVVGKVSKILHEVERIKEKEAEYSNHFLEQYCVDVIDRLS